MLHKLRDLHGSKLKIFLGSQYVFYFLLSLIFITIFRHFLPSTVAVDLFNADMAIPVIMSQDPIASIDSAYYYGQARFGAWPFLILYALGKIFHFVPNIEFLYGFAFCFLASALIVTALNFFKKDKFLFLSLAYLIIATLNVLNGHLFSISFVYVWQLSALLFYFCCIKNAFFKQQTVVKKHLFLAIFFALLATWSNPLSTFLLLPLALIFIINGEKKYKTFLLLFTIIFPFILEYYLRFIYLKYSYAFANSNSYMSLEHLLSFKQILMNFKIQLLKISSPAMACLVIANVFGLYFSLKSNPKSYFVFYSILYCILISVLNFFICVLSEHVFLYQGNSFRYLIPSYFFLFLGTIISLVYLLHDFKYKNILIYLNTFVIILFNGHMLRNNTYDRFKQTAHLLESNYPNAFMFGDYNQVYMYRALQSPKNGLMPVPSDWEINRMPWATDMLKEGQTVIIFRGWTYLNSKPAKQKLDEFTAYGCIFKREEEIMLNNIPLTRYTITKKIQKNG